MINKKNLLGKIPDELGLKDAIYTAIVAVRAGCAIEPGQRCGPNQNREYIPSAKGPGVADPFRKGVIFRGQAFWLLLCQDEVPNVRHEWDHPDIDFSPPTQEATKNLILSSIAEEFSVTYGQLMEAIAYVVENNKPAKYPGNKTEEELNDIYLDRYDIFSEWASETLYEFENTGSACCPEYDYPRCKLFTLKS